MTNSSDIPTLERPSFFDGQRLTADDLAAVQSFNRELRWLHNRSLHSWGIVFGFAVAGAQGERSVRVQPGHALDCLGRELILNEPVELQVPAVSGASNGGPASYYLTASYAEDADLTPEMREGVCGTAGAVRRPESPVIRWQDPNDTGDNRYRRGLDIILATVQVQNCQLAKPVSGAERRDAVPAQQPYIAAGQTEAGKTRWRLWPEGDHPVGVATTVPTTSAGFRATPRYQAHIVGERLFDGALNGVERRFVVEGYPQVAEVTAGGFDLRVILPAGATAGPARAYVVTMNDYLKVANPIATQFGTQGPLILAVNGPTLAVGQTLAIFGAGLFFEPVGPHTLGSSDFTQVLSDIAVQNGVSVDDLLAANGMTPQTVSLTVGQALMISGDPIVLNPPDVVLKEDFLGRLTTELQWYVTWMGVEG